MSQIYQIVLIGLVGIGATFVQRVSGFGLGIFSMLFLPHFMSQPTDAIAISCLFSCVTSTYNAIKYRKHIPFNIILPLVFAAMITIPIAVHFSVLISTRFFEIALGLVLIFLSIYFLFFDNRIMIKPTLKNSLIAGGVGGALNGLFSTGGPPIVLYLTHATTNNIAYFSGIQFYFSITNIYATVLRVINGLVTWRIFVYATIGFCGCMIGNMLGNYIFNKLDSNKLKKIIYIGMIISGIIMIF